MPLIPETFMNGRMLEISQVQVRLGLVRSSSSHSFQNWWHHLEQISVTLSPKRSRTHLTYVHKLFQCTNVEYFRTIYCTLCRICRIIQYQLNAYLYTFLSFWSGEREVRERIVLGGLGVIDLMKFALVGSCIVHPKKMCEQYINTTNAASFAILCNSRMLFLDSLRLTKNP